MSKVPIEYTEAWLEDHKAIFDRLWAELDWVRVGSTPRSEYYCNDVEVSYTYGKGAGVREYKVQPYHPDILAIKSKLEAQTGTKFEACFLNGYGDGSDHLGWHADDSPEMDDERPIAIISLGAEREIWFRPAPRDGAVDEVTKLKLASGSLCLMKPGMQDTHHHRIPKSGVQNCGPRISLTFRGYVGPRPE